MKARWWLVEQQIFTTVSHWLTDSLTKVLLGTPAVSISCANCIWVYLYDQDMRIHLQNPLNLHKIWSTWIQDFTLIPPSWFWPSYFWIVVSNLSLWQWQQLKAFKSKYFIDIFSTQLHYSPFNKVNNTSVNELKSVLVSLNIKGRCNWSIAFKAQ